MFPNAWHNDSTFLLLYCRPGVCDQHLGKTLDNANRGDKTQERVGCLVVAFRCLIGDAGGLQAVWPDHCDALTSQPGNAFFNALFGLSFATSIDSDSLGNERRIGLHARGLATISHLRAERSRSRIIPIQPATGLPERHVEDVLVQVLQRRLGSGDVVCLTVHPEGLLLPTIHSSETRQRGGGFGGSKSKSQALHQESHPVGS